MSTEEREITNGEPKTAYWRANVRLIAILLTIWALVSYVAAILLAEPLQNITFFQVPLSYWFGHQGSMLTFVVLIWVYAFYMDRVDRKHDVHE
jgi:putative solute:sodium symporter small subunit